MNSCSWVQNFLTDRPQVLRIGNHTFSPCILNIGALLGCILSPLIYSLYTHDGKAMCGESSNIIVKFANDMVAVGLQRQGDRLSGRDGCTVVMVSAKHLAQGEGSGLQEKNTVAIIPFNAPPGKHCPPCRTSTPGVAPPEPGKS